MLYKLESLRGIAACLVVLFHSPFHYGEEAITFVSNSYLFVDFFFVLSGFVMTLAYSSRINKSLGFKSYLILRLGRIYPLHIMVLFMWVPYVFIKQYMFSSGFGGDDQFAKNNIESFFTNIFLVNSVGLHDYLSWNNPAWSIGAEFFAYIAFYWLTVTIDKRNSLISPLLISLICYGIIVSLDRKSIDITYDYGFFRCLGAFYIGVFVYRVSYFWHCPITIIRNLTILELLSVLSIIVLVSLANLHLLYFIPVIFMFAFSIFIFSQGDSGRVGRLLLMDPFRKIGIWSYSIYMTHALVVAGFSNVLEYILHWNVESALGFISLVLNLFMLAIIVIISKYSYILIETKFRDRSRRLAKRYSKSM